MVLIGFGHCVINARRGKQIYGGLKPLKAVQTVPVREKKVEPSLISVNQLRASDTIKGRLLCRV